MGAAAETVLHMEYFDLKDMTGTKAYIKACEAASRIPKLRDVTASSKVACSVPQVKCKRRTAGVIWWLVLVYWPMAATFAQCKLV